MAKKKTTKKRVGKGPNKKRTTTKKSSAKEKSSWEKLHPFNKFMWKVTGVVYVIVMLYILLRL